MSRLFTVPLGTPFLPTVAHWLTTQQHDPLTFAQSIIFVPAPRQANALKAALLNAWGEDSPHLLPHILPLGLMADSPLLAGFNHPPEATATQRLLLFTQLLQAKKIPFAQALGQAQQLANVLDELTRYGITPEAVQNLPPQAFARHWQQQLQFLEIILEVYPAWLAEQNLTDPTVAAQQRLDMLAQALTTQTFPALYAVGFADTTPRGAQVLHAVTTHPHGTLILPALDPELPEEAFLTLPPTHPQFGFKEMLTTLGLTRSQVSTLSGNPLPQQLCLIEAPTAQAEARALALRIRELLEMPDHTIALVTPDRPLATAVTQALQAWHIPVDDSAGQPLSSTPHGQWLLLLLHTVTSQLHPQPLTALCKHPLTALTAEHTQALEHTLLRGLPTTKGLSGLRTAFHALPNTPQKTLCNEALNQLAARLQPFTQNPRLAPAEVIPHLPDAAPPELTDLLGSLPADPLPLADLHALLEHLFTQTTVRPLISNARVFIWGPLEARLQQADHLLLGGLNEDMWPPQPTPCPWLHRTAREHLNLPQPERALGLAAQDIRHLLTHPQLTLSRSLTQGAAATTPSRFFTTWAETQDLTAARQQGQVYLHWLAEQERQESAPLSPACATPPLAQRPTSISASQLKNLMTCPYKTYAQKTLRLEEVAELAAAPDARDRGTLLHTLLQGFFETPAHVPPDFPAPFGPLTADNHHAAESWFHQALASLLMPLPEAVVAVWQPRFSRLIPDIVAALLTLEAPPHAHEHTLSTTVSGLTFTAKADRIDHTAEGFMAVDYKTGSAPTAAAMRQGTEPQLPLEAYLLHQNGQPPAGLTVWEIPVGGSGNLTLQHTPLSKLDAALAKQEAAPLLTLVESCLSQLAQWYGTEANGYAAIPSPAACQYCAYAQVCRKEEWSS